MLTCVFGPKLVCGLGHMLLCVLGPILCCAHGLMLFCGSGPILAASSAEAEKQLIEKRYGYENLGDRELIQIACVFNGEKNKRQITMYKIAGISESEKQ